MPMFKYIIFEDNQGSPHLRIFDGLHESHVDVRNSAPSGWCVLGAGEFRCDDSSMSFIRKSVSLRIPFSAEGSAEDARLAKSLYEAV